MYQAMFDPKSLPSEPPGPGVLPAFLLGLGALRDEGLGGLHRVDRHQLLADDRVVDLAVLLRCLEEQFVRRLVDLARAGGADGNALVHQHRRGHPPAVVVLAEQVIGGHAHVGHEDFVELAAAVDLVDRADLDSPVPSCRR